MRDLDKELELNWDEKPWGYEHVDGGWEIVRTPGYYTLYESASTRVLDGNLHDAISHVLRQD